MNEERGAPHDDQQRRDEELLALLEQDGALTGPAHAERLHTSGTSYNPSLDAGTSDVSSYGGRGGQVYVEDYSSAERRAAVGRDPDLVEHMLLYLPRLGGSSLEGGGPGEVTIGASSDKFADLGDFKKRAWKNAGLEPGEGATYAHALVWRYVIGDTEELATSLDPSGVKGRVSRMAQAGGVEGWVFYEPDDFSGGISRIRTRIHQVYPVALILPPKGDVTLVVQPGTMTLGDFIRQHAQAGWRYAQCVGVRQTVTSSEGLTRAKELSAIHERPDGVTV